MDFVNHFSGGAQGWSLDPAQRGIRGNSHMLMMDRNN